MATLHGMWDFRISWLGPEPRSPALGAWSLNQWITREVPLPYLLTSLTFKAQSRLYLANILKAQGSVRALIFNFYCLWPLRKSPLSCFSLASLKNLFKCFTHHLNYFKWKSQLRNLATQLETEACTNSSQLFILLLPTLPEMVGTCDYLGLLKENNLVHSIQGCLNQFLSASTHCTCPGFLQVHLEVQDTTQPSQALARVNNS